MGGWVGGWDLSDSRRDNPTWPLAVVFVTSSEIWTRPWRAKLLRVRGKGRSEVRRERQRRHRDGG